jgi:hypothetical protein
MSPRKLDTDNLQGAFKWIRDEVANQLVPGKQPGRADDDPRISWEYDQEPLSKKTIMKLQIFEKGG